MGCLGVRICARGFGRRRCSCCRTIDARRARIRSRSLAMARTSHTAYRHARTGHAKCRSMAKNRSGTAKRRPKTSAEVWQRIEAALPNADPKPAIRDIVQPVQRGLGFWRGWAIGATAVAAAIVLYLGVTVLNPLQDDGRLIAVLDRPDATGAGWIATVNPSTNEVSVVALTPTPIADDKSHELWYIPSAASQPVSLGLLEGDGQLSGTSKLAFLGGAFAVSLEPKGGSPTGQPTGPILFQGTLHPLPK